MKKLFILTLLSLSVVGCGNAQSSVSSEISSTSISSSEISSSSQKEPLTTLNINTLLQQLYLSDANYKRCPDYAGGTDELSRPNYLTIDLRGGDSYEITMYELTSQKKPADSLVIETTASTYDFYNFKINTYYKYSVRAFKKGEVVRSTSSKVFKTSGYYRNLYVDGVTNFRDIGGYTTEEGKTVKQGLVYRSGTWANDNKACITEKGITAVQNQLKIKSEIDLRNADGGETGGQTESFVPGVTYKCFQMGDYENLTDKELLAIRNMFEFMTHEENYPLNFHCYIGTDRTGLLSFLINGILGCSEERLYREYILSCFGDIGGYRDGTIIDRYFSKIAKFGKTPQEQITNYLLNYVGVTQEQINSIRNILLSD